MDTYPTVPQAEGTLLVPRPGIRLRYASNGTVRARALSSATRVDPMVVYAGISLAQWQSILSFHEAHRGVPFLFGYQPEGSTLTCIFAAKAFDNYKAQLAGPGVTVISANVYLTQVN